MKIYALALILATAATQAQTVKPVKLGNPVVVANATPRAVTVVMPKPITRQPASSGVRPVILPTLPVAVIAKAEAK